MQNENSSTQHSEPPARCGVGIILQPLPTGEFRVKGLAPGSPAEESNMLQVLEIYFVNNEFHQKLNCGCCNKIGDKIIKVNGNSVFGLDVQVRTRILGYNAAW